MTLGCAIVIRTSPCTHPGTASRKAGGGRPHLRVAAPSVRQLRCLPPARSSRNVRINAIAIPKARSVSGKQGTAHDEPVTSVPAEAPPPPPPQVLSLGEGSPSPDGEYEVLRGEYHYPKLQAFFGPRPWLIGSRVLAMTLAAYKVSSKWRAEESLPLEQRTRGAVMREEISKLGPVFVKCGQTLAERPDIIGDEAAGALKLLQGENTPFPNDLAWDMISEDLAWPGPLAPNVPYRSAALADPPSAKLLQGEPLFRYMSEDPIAAASLAQVYKAETWDGRKLAIKVQRPSLLKQVATDMYVLRLGLDLLRATWGSATDLRPIADEVGAGVFRELDFHQEAENAIEFERKLSFLGFVRSPRWEPEFTGAKGRARVLAMEWVEGRKLGQLDPASQLRMVNMAVVASVAQLIRTGFVHADPHAGNLLFDTEGRLVFLDFGLMCRVEPYIMEAFASGICHLLAGDWLGLAYDFRDIGLAPAKAFEKRDPESKLYLPCSAEDFAAGVQRALLAEEDGQTRFGALATGLGGLSSEYKFLCPPFIILLCRTFLTLEGMADVVDPNFSIYTQALPFAVRRALSPETEKGERALRSALLTDSGEFRFGRLMQLLEQVQTLAQDPEAGDKGKAAAAPSAADGRAADGAGASAAPASGSVPGGGFDTVTGLLGSPEGAALRRVAMDADSMSLIRHLTGPSGRPLRRVGEQTLRNALRNWHKRKQEAEEAEIALQMTEEQRANARREAGRRRTAMRVIFLSHVARLFKSGLPGILAMSMLVFVGFRVGLVAALQVGMGGVVSWLASFFLSKRREVGGGEGPAGGEAQPAAAAA